MILGMSGPPGLANSSAQRAKNFHRGSQEYDANQMGYTDAGAYIFDTAGEILSRKLVLRLRIKNFLNSRALRAARFFR